MHYFAAMLAGNPGLMFDELDGPIQGSGAFGDYVFNQEGMIILPKTSSSVLRTVYRSRSHNYSAHGNGGSIEAEPGTRGYDS